jgi:hypothetical protein
MPEGRQDDTDVTETAEVLELLVTVAETVRASRVPGEPGAPRADRDGTDDQRAVAALLAALTALRTLRDQLGVWEPELITAARAAGASWAQLAPALGVTSRQAAERRYLRLLPSVTGEATGEARVQATRDRRAGERAVSRWARSNAAELRQLAGQVSGLSGLAPEARQQADRVHAALAGNDPAGLLDPLARVRTHLAAEHPGLADRITAVAADAEAHRNATLSQRQAAPGT